MSGTPTSAQAPRLGGRTLCECGGLGSPQYCPQSNAEVVKGNDNPILLAGTGAVVKI